MKLDVDEIDEIHTWELLDHPDYMNQQETLLYTKV